MISLKKYFDQQDPGTGKQAPGMGKHDPGTLQQVPARRDDFSQAMLATYCASLSAMADSSVDACPAVGASLRESLLALQSALTANPTAEAVAETGPRVEAQLKQWGTGAAEYFKQRTGEVKEVMIILARSAEVIGERDQRYSTQLHEFTGRLESMANLNDLAEIRDQLVKSAHDLKASAQAMAEESQNSLNQLRQDVSVYQVRLDDAEEKASADPLTGLANRRRVESAIESRLQQERRFSIVVLDLNGFKQVNDTYGHLAGDALLKQFSAELLSAVRATDVVGRWGGDEFIVILDSSLVEAQGYLDRIAKWVYGDYSILVGDATQKVHIGAAHGVASREPGDTLRSLINRADAAMYAHKKSTSAPRS